MGQREVVPMSKVGRSDMWGNFHWYYFPFASRIAQFPYGWSLIRGYMALRIWVENFVDKRGD